MSQNMKVKVSLNVDITKGIRTTLHVCLTCVLEKKVITLGHISMEVKMSPRVDEKRLRTQD
jgi:hypothetical protein